MLLMNVVATAEMVAFKGIVARVVEIVDVILSSALPTALFAIKLVRLVTSVVSVVAVTVAMVDRGVVARVIGTIIVDNVVTVLVMVDGNWVVGSNVLPAVVVCSVDAIALMVVIVVVFMGVSVGANGNFGQLSSRFGPSILSNT